MWSRFAVAVVVVVSVGFIGSGLRVQGLEGPHLYVYADRAVYPPGSTVVFRVLAINADGGPAPDVNILATVYDPDFGVVGQFEGVTDAAGRFDFAVVVEAEGLYTVSVQDASADYGGSEFNILVCSSCPYEVSTVTVTSTATVTTSVGTVTSTISNIVTSPVTTTYTFISTITSLTTFTVYSSYGTSTTTVVTTSTVKSVEVVETTRTSTVFRTDTVTVHGTVRLTETVRETVVSTFVSTVAGATDRGLTATAIFALALALLVFSVVLYVVRRVAI